MKRLLLSLLSLVSLSGIFALSGCSANFNSVAAPPTTQSTMGVIRGRSYGGQQPIVGASVYLFAVGTSAYGGTSLSLLCYNQTTSTHTNCTGNVDTFGDSYVVTDANGEFNISGDYGCTYSATAPQVLYLYSVGGNAGGGTNSGAGLMAVLGTCPPSGSFSGSSALPYVFMNEVSTVAAAYALAGYATDARDISVGGAGGATNVAPTVLASQGLINAAANAAQMYDISGATTANQSANSVTPNGNGTVPAALINSIANSLAACVNTGAATTGSTTPNPVPYGLCTTLFNLLPVGPSGAQPTDTATAAIYIAKNPGENVASIYNVATQNPVFAPVLSKAPYDFSLGIVYTASGMTNPNDIAIDSLGNAYITSPGGNLVTKLSSLGVATPYIEKNPNYIEVDATGSSTTSLGLADVWTTSPNSYTSGSNAGNNVLCVTNGTITHDDCYYEISNNGVLQTPSYLGGGIYELINAQSIVSDGVYNYIADYGNNRVVETDQNHPSSGFESSRFATTPAAFQYLAVSSTNGYIWGTADSGISKGIICRYIAHTNPGTCPYSTSTVTPERIMTDASANAYFVDSSQNKLYRVIGGQPSGIIVSPSGGYSGGGLNTPFGLILDGNGIAWTTNTGSITFGSGASSTTCTGCSITGISIYSGSAVTPATVGTAGSPYYNPKGGFIAGNTSGSVGFKNIAVDGSGDLWVTNSAENSVTEFMGIAAPTVTPLAYAINSYQAASKP